MDKFSSPVPPDVHQLPQKQNLSVQFPLQDITILQNPKDCPCRWINWKVLKTLRSALKLGQIITSIVILALLRTRNRISNREFESFPEVPYIFFTYNAMAVTFLMLGDSMLQTHPIRRVFTPLLWFRVELWFTGLAAVVHHLLAYFVLFVAFQYYGIDTNRVASAFGFVSTAFYLADWWRIFSKRHETIQEVYSEVNLFTDKHQSSQIFER